MHIPDGYLDAPTSLATGLLAAGALAWCLRTPAVRAVDPDGPGDAVDPDTFDPDDERLDDGLLDDRRIPLAGMAAAYIFAVQMVNFPVAAGTSGHLLGGVLAAVLVGPRLGALCVAMVLVVQGLLFADGGLSALGANVVNMAVVGALGGAVIFRLVCALLPRTRTAVVAASAIAAGLAPALAAVAFTIEYAVGGNGAASIGHVAGAMIGVHLLIGIGEAAITALTVSTVLSVRPDLVHGARHLRRPVVAAGGAAVGAS